MIEYTDLTKKALRIALNAHAGQVDKCDMPYVLHPVIVAERVQVEAEYADELEIAVCAALLHDVVEDSDWTFEGLRAEGIPESVLEVLMLLTHDESVPYLDYVAHLKPNRIARAVKLADLSHNMQLGRIDSVTEKDLERIAKYKKARAMLLAE